MYSQKTGTLFLKTEFRFFIFYGIIEKIDMSATKTKEKREA